MKSMFVAIWIAFAIISSSSYAGDLDRMRCGSKFIKIGMDFSRVKTACGINNKPVNIERYTKQTANPNVRYSDGSVPVDTHLIEKWTFAVRGKFITHVYFKNGRVAKIFQTSKRK